MARRDGVDGAAEAVGSAVELPETAASGARRTAGSGADVAVAELAVDVAEAPAVDGAVVVEEAGSEA